MTLAATAGDRGAAEPPWLAAPAQRSTAAQMAPHLRAWMRAPRSAISKERAFEYGADHIARPAVAWVWREPQPARQVCAMDRPSELKWHLRTQHPDGTDRAVLPTERYNAARTPQRQAHGSPPGARIRRSRASAWRTAVLAMVPIAVARAAVRLHLWSLFWLVCGGFPLFQYRALFGALHSSGKGPKTYLSFLDWGHVMPASARRGQRVEVPHREIQ